MGHERTSSRSTLRIDACGPIEIYLDDTAVHHDIPRKAAALLVLLADKAEPVDRSTLAGLMWSDQTEERARGNLRVTLSRLRTVMSAHIGSDRRSLWLEGDVTYDVDLLHDSDAASTAALYRSDFLADFEESGAELFDDWVFGRRALLRAKVTDRLFAEATQARQHHDLATSRQLAEHVVRVEPGHEPAHRLILESIAATSGPAAALAQFEHLRQQLLRDYAATPEAETIRLADTFRRGDIPLDATAHERAPIEKSLPHWPTELVGRQEALAELHELVRPGRPVSIVGPGGIGKSRLLAAYAQQRRQTDTPTHYVSFEGFAPTEGATTERLFAETVLAALGVPADGEAGAVDSLHRHLGESSIVLCLDNLEQLADVERAIVALCRSCPRVEVVVTTRRRLVLTTGRVFELGGLRYENTASSDVADEWPPAIKLFLDRAARTPGSDPEIALIEHVCELLNGHPLALELASQWAATTSLRELVDLIESPADLASDAPDLPTRHQSLDVLVSASVDQLSNAGRRVLRAASMYSGPFSRADVEALVPITENELSQLVKYSLVSIDADLYQLHSHIRRHASTRLETVDDGKTLAAKHATRMVDVLDEFQGSDRSDTAFQQRSEDCRQAIAWLIDHATPEELLQPLRNYLAHQRAWGWLEASRSTIDRALGRTDLPPVVRAELHRHAAETFLHSDETERAIAELERGLALVGAPFPAGTLPRVRWNASQIARLAGAPLRLHRSAVRDRASERARLMGLLGELFYVSDRRAEMGSYGLGSLAAGRVSREPVLMAAGDAAISIASQLSGAHRLSRHYLKRSRRRIGQVAANSFTAAETFGITAVVSLGAGRYADARNDCQHALAAAQASGRTRMSTQVETLEALIDFHEQDYEAALKRLANIEASIYRNGFRRALTWVHATQAEIALRTSDVGLALTSAHQALEVAQSYSRIEDQARASAALARAEVARDRTSAAVPLLRTAAAGLAAPSALGIQHFELHCGAAELAHEQSQDDATLRPLATELTSRLKAYTKAFPVASDRYRHLTKR